MQSGHSPGAGNAWRRSDVALREGRPEAHCGRGRGDLGRSARGEERGQSGGAQVAREEEGGRRERGHASSPQARPRHRQEERAVSAPGTRRLYKRYIRGGSAKALRRAAADRAGQPRAYL